MFKRVFWMSTGMAVGAGSAFWAKRKVEQTVEQYLPEQVVARVGTTATDLGRTVREAAAEGRAAMRATEAELRARVEARTFVGPDAKASRTTEGSSARGSSGGRRTPRPSAQAGTGSAGRRRARR